MMLTSHEFDIMHFLLLAIRMFHWLLAFGLSTNHYYVDIFLGDYLWIRYHLENILALQSKNRAIFLRWQGRLGLILQMPETTQSPSNSK